MTSAPSGARGGPDRTWRFGGQHPRAAPGRSQGPPAAGPGGADRRAGTNLLGRADGMPQLWPSPSSQGHAQHRAPHALRHPAPAQPALASLFLPAQSHSYLQSASHGTARADNTGVALPGEQVRRAGLVRTECQVAGGDSAPRPPTLRVHRAAARSGNWRTAGERARSRAGHVRRGLPIGLGRTAAA